MQLDRSNTVKEFVRYILSNGAYIDSTADPSAGEEEYYYVMGASKLEPLLEFLTDDVIDQWHESETDQPLYQWLGITEGEYKIFLEGGLADLVLKNRGIRRG